jgi:B12-binding domain/radical SAM domain protein
LFDIVLLHPPSVYDFRKRPIYSGILTATVGTSSQFEVEPIGFTSLRNHLEEKGFEAHQENLTMRMLFDKGFDVEDYIRSTDARLFGIDLHWLVHAHGSLEIAKICKKHHPETPIAFGGLTASRFRREIIESFPFIDYVIRGDGERPLSELLEYLSGKRGIGEVANLCWRERGDYRENQLQFVIEDLDFLDYTSSLRNEAADPTWNPNQSISRAIVPLVRGCSFNCATCGGSRYAYSNLFGRRKLAVRSPNAVVEDLVQIQQKCRLRKGEHIFLVGDPRLGGEKYWRELFKSIGQSVDLPILIELFYPASNEFLAAALRSMPRTIFQISPDSAVESVRSKQGRAYSNLALEKTVNDCIGLGGSIEVFFMLGLPHETKETATETIGYLETIVKRYVRSVGPDRDRRQFAAEIGPMILLDAGSRAFDAPEEYGYRLRYRTLREHHDALGKPHWKDFINYETTGLTHNQLAELFLEAGLRKLETDEKYGTIPAEVADRLHAYLVKQYPPLS